jgi:ribonuclease HII
LTLKLQGFEKNINKIKDDYMLCGIDEAGRGPLAGDLVIAGCILNRFIDGLNDSKKLSEKKRESLYEAITKNSTYHIVKFSAKEIDELGISICLKRGLQEIIKNLPCQEYLFDGNSNFGIAGLPTMIKADGKVAEVSAASILAKVTHDRDIMELAKKYPQYQLEKHKGYGTALHIEMIMKHGYSEIHRKSYKLKALAPRLF